ncbi:MAG: hypothetical protein M0Z45_03990 [Actinomycetota bacterium]|nr:hypothetical protein [Actinomycetota bacterium]
MGKPRRVLIDWDYGASGIWKCSTREEITATAPEAGRWSGEAPVNMPASLQWSNLLSPSLLDSLKSWNRSFESADMTDERNRALLEDEGRNLALCVQSELGVESWELFYIHQGRVHRINPPGSWPIKTWEVDLLGYPPPGNML